MITSANSGNSHEVWPPSQAITQTFSRERLCISMVAWQRRGPSTPPQVALLLRSRVGMTVVEGAGKKYTVVMAAGSRRSWL